MPTDIGSVVDDYTPLGPPAHVDAAPFLFDVVLVVAQCMLSILSFLVIKIIMCMTLDLMG
jgi:hypothetical protein